MEKAWYLVYAKPREEKTALLNLERQQYQCFLPMIRTRKRRRERVVLNDEPLFPRYLFIHLEVGIHDFGPIRSTRGVAQLVRFGGMPAKVPGKLIDLMQAQERIYFETASTQLRVQPGDRVRVMSGVMAGYEGVFEKKTGGERACVLLEIANKFTQLSVDLDSLDRVL